MSPVYQGFARQAARGRVRVRQFANWHLTAGMVPQASAPRKWHGRLGSASLGLACFGRQRSMGKDSTPPHGRRRDASQGSICPGMARQEWTGGRLVASPGRQRFARHGETARQAWLGYSLHGKPRQAAQCITRNRGARQVWLAKARIDQFWNLTAGSATSGMAWPFTAGKASPDVQGLAWLHKSRQEWRL